MTRQNYVVQERPRGIPMCSHGRGSIAIVTSIHPDFDKRIWRHARSVVQAGWDVHLICPWKLRNGSIQEGVTFHTFEPVPSRMRRPLLIPYRVYSALRPLIIRDAVQIIHFHDIDLLPLMALLSLRNRLTVYDVHENYADEMLVRHWVPPAFRKTLSYFVLHFERLFSRIVRNVVLVADSQAPTFDVPGLRKMYLRNYASKSLIERVTDDYMSRDDAVVFIGTQTPLNGSLLFLEIAELTNKLRPQVKFLATDLFTDQKFREKYIYEIKSRDLTGVVELLPPVPAHDITRVLNRATIAINPVIRADKQIKAINTKLFEFMAAGLPVVTSDLPYPTELMHATSAGLLGAPENPVSFVDAICRLVDDRRLSQEIGRNGFEAFCETYSWESQIPELMSFYGSILREASKLE